MGDVHQLVLSLGREEALQRLPKSMHASIEVAAKVMEDENGETGFAYSGFALTAFPYRSLPADHSWTKEGHRVTMTIDPGTLKVGGKVKKFGVPFGAAARLVMIYLQSEAVRNQSPVVELGGSLRQFATKRLSLEWGGTTGKNLQDQIYRLSACSMKFFWDTESKEHFESATIIRRGAFSKETDEKQGRLWEDTVMLDEAFYENLRKHAIPLQESAIKALCDEPVALDVYVWLAYRLRILDRDTPVSWAALKEQFGLNYKTVRQFKYKFVPSLQKALAAYPDARVSLEDDKLILRPSAPPVKRIA
jgi:hypothetical protein